jgi:predicted small lipoprotein YifL
MTFGLTCAVLAGCGLKGPLYLPEQTGEIVTRPTPVPPETTSAPNSPQTVDSPAAGATPAPEVTTPQADDDQADDDQAESDPDKKDKGPAPSPH